MVKSALQRFINILSVGIFLLGCIGIIVSLIDATFTPIQFLMALCFSLISLSLFLINANRTRYRNYISILVGLCSLVACFEFFYLGNLLFNDPIINLATFKLGAGSMEYYIVLCLIVSISALVFPPKLKLVGYSGSFIFFCSAFTLISYLIDLNNGHTINLELNYLNESFVNYPWWRLENFSWYTNIGFLIIGSAIISLHRIQMIISKSNSSPQQFGWFYMQVIPIIFILFLIDLILPEEFYVSGGYAIVVVSSLLIRGKSHAIWLSIICSLLIIFPFLLSDYSPVKISHILNHLLAMIMIWISAFFSIQVKKENQRLFEANKLTRRMNFILKNKNKELEQLMYMVSHDLKEPLQTVINFTSLIQDEIGEKENHNVALFLSFINKSTDRMNLMVKSILDYSILGSKRKIDTVDCNVLMNDIQNDLYAKIKESNALITVNNLPILRACEIELHSLFSNIISNAIKYQNKEINPEINVSASLNNEIWEFSIEDNGIGILPEHTDRIFNIFQRLHFDDTIEGTGIGLTECRKIVHLHNGTIWVNSKFNEGSVFYFTIPNSKL